MPKQFLFLMAFMACFQVAFSKPTTLTGRAAYMPNTPLSALGLIDYISGDRELLVTTSTDEFGYFEMSFEIDEITPITLQLNGLVATLFAEPGATYDFDIPTIERKDPHAFSHMKVDVEWPRVEGHNINVSVAGFNSKYDFFFKEFLPDLAEARFSGSSSYVRSNRERLASANLIAAVDDSLVGVQNQDFVQRIENFRIMQEKMMGDELVVKWFRDYMDYAMAATLVTAGMSRDSVYTSFFEGKPVQLKHPEYMSALQQLYGGTVMEVILSNEVPGIKTAALRERDAFVVDSLLAEMPMMGDQDVRRAALLLNLQKAYYERVIDRQVPFDLLQNMAARPDDFGWAAEVAQGLISGISFGQRGQAVANFRIQDSNQDWVELKDYEGKFLYVMVFSKWCRDCESQMQALTNFYRRYQRDVEILCIGMDPDDSGFDEFVDKHSEEFTWTFLYGPSDPEVQDHFGLRTIPQYFFIDPDGNWAVDHAPSPADGALQMMERAILKWKNTNQPKVTPFMGK